VDIDVFVKSRDVIDGLSIRTCTAALQWCVDNKSRLRKLNSTLEFQLRLQEFLEMVRNYKKHEAIEYARKYLTAKKTEEEKNEIVDAANMALVQRAMATLAFGPTTSISPYKELFLSTRWTELEDLFKRDFYLLYSCTTKPLLFITMQAGLSALKTP
jgi:macrophage erythroblast attacher